MAFKKVTYESRKIQMVSLIDLIFILLIFFIIASILIKLTKGESQLFIPTPKNEPGEAQILIQILDDDKYLWIDHTAIDTLLKYRQIGLNSQGKIDLLLDKMSFGEDELKERVEGLKTEAINRPSKDFFVLIRCPEDKPYYYATNIIEKLVDNPNLEYGCVSGAIEDIRNSRKIVAEGNVLQIDF